MEHLELFIKSIIFDATIDCISPQNILQGCWQPEGDTYKYTVAIKVMKEGTSAQSQNELLQVCNLFLMLYSNDHIT